MTFDDYDALIEKYASLSTPKLWPTPEQLALFEKDPEKWIPFLIYLAEYGDEPKNNEEKYSKRGINEFLREHLILVDPEEDTI